MKEVEQHGSGRESAAAIVLLRIHLRSHLAALPFFPYLSPDSLVHTIEFDALCTNLERSSIFGRPPDGRNWLWRFVDQAETDADPSSVGHPFCVCTLQRWSQMTDQAGTCALASIFFARLSEKGFHDEQNDSFHGERDGQNNRTERQKEGK